MFDNLREDIRRLELIKSKPFPFNVLESLLFENGFQAVVLHRLAHWFKRRRIPVIGPLVSRTCLFLTGVDIAPGCEIGPGLMISHGSGLVIGDRVKIGRGALLLQDVTIGARALSHITEMPTLGDNVLVGAGARLIGGIQIGDDVVVGTNAVVTCDVPSGTKVLVKQDLVFRR